MKSPSRALLAALLAVVGALVALTLSAGAQTPGGELGPDESGSTETAQGRIIARVQDRTGEDGVDDYRIEFGFFPEWALDEAESWPEAIASRSDWLPSSRFLTKSRIDARAAAGNRGWLRSSLISVPAQSPSGAGAEITGRVIARYNPDSEGRLRVEFGFVPEWAFTDTASTEEAVQRLGADGLPSARYLSVATIDARRDVWLRSSVVDVPLRAPVVVIEQPQAPVIDGVSCAPSSPTVDESVTCTATLSGGAPDSYAWSGGASGGSGATYTTSFGTAGEATVSLTVTNVVGSDTESTTLTVAEPFEEPLEAPVIDGIDCSPSSPAVDESVTCTAALSGGAPDSYAWSGGASGGSGATYTTSFGTAGEATVSLTVTNVVGSDTESTTLTVAEPFEEPLEAPVIDGIDCSPSSPAVDESVTCTAALSGGAAESWAWRTANGSGNGSDYTTSFSKAGDYTISLTVTNSAGSDSDSITINVEEPAEESAEQAPVIESIDCDRVSTWDIQTNCMATLSGGDPDSWAWSGGDYESDSDRYSPIFDTAGEYTISLTVTNAAGSDSASFTFTITAPPPYINYINCSPTSPVVGESVTCTADLGLRGGDPDSYAWSGGASSGSDERYTTSFDTAGEYTVSLTATNSIGSDTYSVVLTVVAASTGEDLQPPVIDSINCSPESPTAGESMTCTAALSGGAPDSWAWRGGGASSDSDRGSGESFTPRFDIQGRFMVALTVTNAAGSDSDSVTLTVAAASTGDGGESTAEPLQPPVIDSITCSPESPTTEDEFVDCTANLSGGAPDSYSWSGGEYESTSDSYTTTSFDTAGEYTVSLTVTNSSGSDTDSITLTVTVPPPVINYIGCLPTSPTVSESVTCAANISGGFPDSWAWSDSASGNGNRTIYGTAYFETAGEYTVSLTVTNSGGSDSDSVTFTVVEPSLAPVINFIRCTPSSPEVRYDDVTCTAALSGGAPTSWDWSGGEGYSATLTRATRIYETNFETAGERTVSLTVTNDAGSDTESITLTVVTGE